MRFVVFWRRGDWKIRSCNGDGVYRQWKPSYDDDELQLVACFIKGKLHGDAPHFNQFLLGLVPSFFLHTPVHRFTFVLTMLAHLLLSGTKHSSIDALIRIWTADDDNFTRWERRLPGI
jgi:hypothetical protein